MHKKITITFDVPVCECGVQGDLLIDIEDSNIFHIWCKVCGERLKDKTQQDTKENNK